MRITLERQQFVEALAATCQYAISVGMAGGFPTNEIEKRCKEYAELFVDEILKDEECPLKLVGVRGEC